MSCQQGSVPDNTAQLSSGDIITFPVAFNCGPGGWLGGFSTDGLVPYMVSGGEGLFTVVGITQPLNNLLLSFNFSYNVTVQCAADGLAVGDLLAGINAGMNAANQDKTFPCQWSVEAPQCGTASSTNAGAAAGPPGNGSTLIIAPGGNGSAGTGLNTGATGTCFGLGISCTTILIGVAVLIGLFLVASIGKEV